MDSAERNKHLGNLILWFLQRLIIIGYITIKSQNLLKSSGKGGSCSGGAGVAVKF